MRHIDQMRFCVIDKPLRVEQARKGFTSPLHNPDPAGPPSTARDSFHLRPLWKGGTFVMFGPWLPNGATVIQKMFKRFSTP